ncbi:MAG TPA: hypothetical protein VGI29_04700, partial [Candidatus Binataceae bacterium]
PQPIAELFIAPPVMLAAAGHILQLLAEGRRSELEALAIPRAAAELNGLIDAIAPGAYGSHKIIAHAKVNHHYYVKARLFGERAAPFTLQLRLGEHEGRWVIWEAYNLAGGRTAWTR